MQNGCIKHDWWLVIGDWWLVLSLNNSWETMTFAKVLCICHICLGMNPKTLTHQSVIEEFKNSWAQSGKASLLSIFWWRKALVGLSWLIHHILLLLHRTHLPLPRWHPRTRKNDMFSATYGETEFLHLVVNLWLSQAGFKIWSYPMWMHVIVQNDHHA